MFVIAGKMFDNNTLRSELFQITVGTLALMATVTISWVGRI